MKSNLIKLFQGLFKSNIVFSILIMVIIAVFVFNANALNTELNLCKADQDVFVDSSGNGYCISEDRIPEFYTGENRVCTFGG